MYGVTKVAGELLCDYYFQKFGVDVREGLSGELFHIKLYQVQEQLTMQFIFIMTIKNKAYTSYIGKGTQMDMLYIPDALKAVVDLMEADGSKLKDRNAFNITAMSLTRGNFWKKALKSIFLNLNLTMMLIL